LPQLASSVAELAASPVVRGCLDWFRRERNWINEKHLSLCRIPAPTFFEQQRAEWFVQEFRALGWDAKIDRAGNVIATRPGYEALPQVAVTAHLDTVFAPRTPDDIRVSEGRFVGPGVSDNGAGLTALLAIAAAWDANPLLRDAPLDPPAAAPVLIANVGEEGEGNLSGMRYICRGQDRPRSFLILDGPGIEHITSRALASRRFEIAFLGPGGHSWRDSAVGNPIHAASRAITSFLDQARDLHLPRTSYNFGIIEGGVSINSIPTEARAKIDLRSESNDYLDALSAILINAVEQAAADEGGRNAPSRLSARIKEIGSRPSGTLADDAPILEAVRAVDTFLGIRSHLDCSSTDANIPLSLGLQALSIGAGGHGGGAHTSSEWYSPEGRDAGLRRIFLSLCLLLSAE
jgi:tripeptide aminopeptidase